MGQNTKNIAYISIDQFDPFLRDGGSICLLSLLRFIKNQGNQVNIINILVSDIPYKLFIDNLAADQRGNIIREGQSCHAFFRGIDYYEEVLPYGTNQQLNGYQSVLKTIIKIIQQKNIDYVITADKGFLPILAAWLLQIPGMHLFNSLDNVKGFAGNKFYTHLLKGRSVFAVSQFVQTQIKELLDIDALVWHPVIDFSEYQIRRERIRTNAIGFSSTQGKWKGDAVVAEIIQQLPEFLFVVIGYRCGIRYALFPNNVIHLGHLSDMKKFYEKIDVLLVPSLVEEGFGLVIIEAAINGIPVIANRVGGIPEAIGDGGILIDWDHAKEPDIIELARRYAQEIRYLLNDDQVYEKYCQKAFARAKQYIIDQTQMSQKFYNNYIRT